MRLFPPYAMKPGALEMRRRLPAAREAGAGCSLLGALVLKPQRMRKIWQTNHTCYAKVRGSCTRTISRTAYHTLCDTASTSSATSLPWNASHSPRLLGFGHYSRANLVARRYGSIDRIVCVSYTAVPNLVCAARFEVSGTGTGRYCS